MFDFSDSLRRGAAFPLLLPVPKRVLRVRRPYEPGLGIVTASGPVRGEGAPIPDARSVGRMMRPEERGAAAVGDVGDVAAVVADEEEAAASVGVGAGVGVGGGGICCELAAAALDEPAAAAAAPSCCSMLWRCGGKDRATGRVNGCGWWKRRCGLHLHPRARAAPDGRKEERVARRGRLDGIGAPSFYRFMMDVCKKAGR